METDVQDLNKKAWPVVAPGVLEEIGTGSVDNPFWQGREKGRMSPCDLHSCLIRLDGESFPHFCRWFRENYGKSVEEEIQACSTFTAIGLRKLYKSVSALAPARRVFISGDGLHSPISTALGAVRESQEEAAVLESLDDASRQQYLDRIKTKEPSVAAKGIGSIVSTVRLLPEDLKCLRDHGVTADMALRVLADLKVAHDLLLDVPRFSVEKLRSVWKSGRFRERLPALGLEAVYRVLLIPSLSKKAESIHRLAGLMAAKVEKEIAERVKPQVEEVSF